MHNRTLLGILCLCLGVLVFSLQDALIKAVSGAYPVSQAMIIRACVALPILLFIVHRDVGLAALRSKNAGLLAARATILFISYIAYYLSFPALPLADAVALFYVAPLLIIVLAGPFLGERISWQSLVSVAVGMAGVIVMVRPGAGLFEWAALLSLFSAGLYSVSQIMARRIGVQESATVMSFYQNAAFIVGGSLITGIVAMTSMENVTHPSIAFLVRPWVWPTLLDFLMMAACGVVASAGMILLSQAYRMAPANKVATFEYTGILWTPLWGFLFFGEVPGARTIAGAALIVGAGLFVLNASGRGSARQAAPAIPAASALD